MTMFYILQLMEDGMIGHHGASATSRVEVDYKNKEDIAPTQFHWAKVVLVWEPMYCLEDVDGKSAQVSRLNAHRACETSLRA